MSLEVNLSSNSCEDVLVAMKTIRVKMSDPGERAVEEVHIVPNERQKEKKMKVTVKIPKKFPKPEKTRPVPTFRPVHLSMREGWQRNAQLQDSGHSSQNQSLTMSRDIREDKTPEASDEPETANMEEVQLTPKSKMNKADHMCLSHLEEKLKDAKNAQRAMADKILRVDVNVEEKKQMVKDLEKKEKEIFVTYKLMDRIRGVKVPREMKTADQLVRAYGDLQLWQNALVRRRESRVRVRDMFAFPPLAQGQ